MRHLDFILSSDETFLSRKTMTSSSVEVMVDTD